MFALTTIEDPPVRVMLRSVNPSPRLQPYASILCILLRARRANRHLRYVISDDGVGLSASPLGHRTGLSNVSRRLQLLFPDDHTLPFTARSPCGTVVTLAFRVST